MPRYAHCQARTCSPASADASASRPGRIDGAGAGLSSIVGSILNPARAPACGILSPRPRRRWCMFDRSETERQLRESLRVLELALAGTAERWHRPSGEALPPDFRGVAMNLANLAVYEERIAAPVLEALAEGGDASDAIPPGATPDWEEREAAELSREPIGRILERLRAARERQVTAVRRIQE